ncbi:HepT-like ribonuclease domain-containing protein [Sphingomonas sp.]|uniref:HepT-like ribonuclease domain-containing protein n=1 Tax=Sphingomonas sp. TaxID=28214 RepID=UPI002580EBF5|nr:HepT-like ribonuclease domain-containing protein [Sphingomonas sp.]
MTASTLSERTRSRLRDMIEDADRVAGFIDGMTVETFVADERTVFAVERLLQRITEAAIQIPPEDAARLGPDIPVAKMRALGNRLRHEYRDVARDIIFDLVRIEVPLVRAAAELALEMDR